jgi:hypothetical protein
LQSALEDVEGDLEQAKKAGLLPDYRDAFSWLYESAQQLRSAWIEPRGT